ncbi:RDD family protein [Nocardioides jejuensis]|nr:RDD family protein [Nocardioides jejuensis]
MTDASVPYAAPTPQPTSSYATWGDRARAWLWDLVYNLPPVVLMFLAIIPLGIGGSMFDEDSVSVPAVSLFCAGIGLMVAATCWSLWRSINNYVIRQGRTGQTYGKARVGIWVVNEQTGAAPGWGSCLGRMLLHGLINEALYLDYLWPLWDQPKVQTLTDKILSTVVVKRV